MSERTEEGRKPDLLRLYILKKRWRFRLVTRTLIRIAPDETLDGPLCSSKDTSRVSWGNEDPAKDAPKRRWNASPVERR